MMIMIDGINPCAEKEQTAGRQCRTALPSGDCVGIMDKFHGHEAPICLVSMTAPSADETTRGMEFLFSLNRINVAVSRAKALALVFGAPRLREAKCETVEQMRLVNTLCALQTIILTEKEEK